MSGEHDNIMAYDDDEHGCRVHQSPLFPLRWSELNPYYFLAVTMTNADMKTEKSSSCFYNPCSWWKGGKG